MERDQTDEVDFSFFFVLYWVHLDNFDFLAGPRSSDGLEGSEMSTDGEEGAVDPPRCFLALLVGVERGMMAPEEVDFPSLLLKLVV